MLHASTHATHFGGCAWHCARGVEWLSHTQFTLMHTRCMRNTVARQTPSVVTQLTAG
jgi:hypothetical protein